MILRVFCSLHCIGCLRLIDIPGATAALRAWDSEVFYDKEMRIEYAKTRSHATRKVEEPGWDPLAEAKAKALGLGSRLGANGAGGNKGRITTSSNAEAMEIEREKDQSGSKRDREDETTSTSTGRTAKRGRGQEDGEEMDMDDDREATPSNVAAQAQGVPPMVPIAAISSRLLCTNLPPDITTDALQILFQQYAGFHSVLITPAGASKSAQVQYEQVEQAAVAKEALLKKGWAMSVVFV